jgi:hypothetical protein
MPEFCSSRITSAIAKALLGERAARCTNLTLEFSADKLPSVTATFLLLDEDAQALGSALSTETWTLVDAEASKA